MKINACISEVARGCAEICKKCGFVCCVIDFEVVECRFGILFNLKTFNNGKTKRNFEA